MAHYLLTGAAGFIGERTAALLLEGGHSVTGIDNLNDYYPVALKRYRLDRLKAYRDFVFYELDIEDGPGLERALGGEHFDAVINLAARAGVRYSMENPQVYFSTNVIGLLNILEYMRAQGIGKLVQASTSSLYAGQDTPFSESLPVNTPISPYAASKKAAETLCYTYHHLYGIDVTITRFFTVYGPAGRPDMAIFKFIKLIHEGLPITIYGDGNQSRDFTFIDDIATGTIRALAPLGFEIINLGGGKKPVSMHDIVKRIESLLDTRAEITYKSFNPADMKVTWAEIAKAHRLLDWRPTTSIDEGLAACVSWYKNNQEWLARIFPTEGLQQ